MTYAVGPGLLTEMSLYEDQPAGDSFWPPWGELAVGESGRLFSYLKSTGRIFVYEPAGLAVSPPVIVPIPFQPALAPKPEITWIGSQHFTAGRSALPARAIVLHTMAGSLAGSDAWFGNPVSQVSAHFGINLAGAIHQYVQTADTAWANGILETGNVWPGSAGVNPNRESISIETEDLNDAQQIVTAEQYAAVLALGKWLMTWHSSVKWLVTHRAISPRSRPHCPGERWRPWLPDLASDLGLTLVE